MRYEYEAKDRTLPTRQVYMPLSLPAAHTAWKSVQTYLESRELNYTTALANGWYPSKDAGDNALRLVIPAVNSNGTVYWQARALNSADLPRYQSAPTPRGNSVIQVWPEQTDYIPLTIIVEGPMDALAAASHGLRAIAIMGNHPTVEMYDMLVALIDTDKAVFYADKDALKESVTIVATLLGRGVNIFLADPSPYKDLAATPRKKRGVALDMLRRMIEVSDQKINRQRDS